MGFTRYHVANVHMWRRSTRSSEDIMQAGGPVGQLSLGRCTGTRLLCFTHHAQRFRDHHISDVPACASMCTETVNFKGGRMHMMSPRQGSKRYDPATSHNMTVIAPLQCPWDPPPCIRQMLQMCSTWCPDVSHDSHASHAPKPHFFATRIKKTL